MKKKSLLIVAGGLISILHALGQDVLVYDQPRTNPIVPTASWSYYTSVIQTNTPLGQSFTPSFSKVGFVQFVLRDYYPSNGLGATVYINLRQDSITGAIMTATSPVNLPDSFGTVIPTNTIVTFRFPTEVAVTPGIKYYFDVVVQSGDFLSICDTQSGYSRGNGYVKGAIDWNKVFGEGIVANPILTVSNSGSSITVSWPTVLSGFVLEQNADLSNTNWSTSSYPITTNGETKNVTISPPVETLFFRLKQ